MSVCGHSKREGIALKQEMEAQQKVAMLRAKQERAKQTIVRLQLKVRAATRTTELPLSSQTLGSQRCVTLLAGPPDHRGYGAGGRTARYHDPPGGS